MKIKLAVAILSLIQVLSCKKGENLDQIKFINDDECIIEDSSTYTEDGVFSFKFNRITNRTISNSNNPIININAYDIKSNSMFIYYNNNSNFDNPFKIVDKNNFKDILPNEITIEIYGNGLSANKYIAILKTGFIYIKNKNQLKFCSAELEYLDINKKKKSIINGKLTY
jgi:hypothetical protein